MGYIRLEAIAEYLVEPLRRCCADPDPYVRKTAAICIAKLYAEDESCVTKLLTALNECTEWGQVFVLDALINYDPPTARVAESMIDRVTARLSHANAAGSLRIFHHCFVKFQVFAVHLRLESSLLVCCCMSHVCCPADCEALTADSCCFWCLHAVVLSAVKVIMKLLEKVTNPEVITIVHRKLCPPLVTLLSAEPELQYVALRNIELIVRRRPSILANEVKMFFCKFNDPLYIKIEKLDVLVGLASERNLDCVLAELREYSNDVDHEMARRSIRCFGQLCMRLPSAVERCLQILLELLSHKAAYAVQECAVVLRDIFRKYPGDYGAVVAALCESVELMDEPEARASIVWIVGQYSEHGPDATGLLATFVSSFLEEVGSVQLQILTAAVKLFMLHPRQNQQLVTKLLKTATEEAGNPDVRDRAYIYWRMLSRNPEATRKIVFASKPAMNAESGAIDNKTLASLIENISMVASVYHKLPSTFVTRVRPAAALRSGSSKVVGQGLRTQASEEEPGQMAVERARREIEKQQEERRSVESSSSSSRSRSEGSNSVASSDEGPVDLLDLNDSSPAAASNVSQSLPPEDLELFFIIASAQTLARSKKRIFLYPYCLLRSCCFQQRCPVPQVIVLAPDTPGSQQQQRGLEIRAALHRPEGGALMLYLTVTNKSASALSDFAVQFNKNSFGLAPGAPLSLPTIASGATAEASLPVVPNQLNSNTPPTLPLTLQIAVKCSLDIFYFSVPYSVAEVLEDRGPIHKELFRQHWQALGEAKQAAFMGAAQQPLNTQDATQLLKLCRVNLVAQRAADTYDALYFSAVTTNNLLVLLELSLQKGAQGVKLAIRTDAAALVNLFKQLVGSVLGVVL
ncbi:hypothetical protein ACSSS7_004295 [Eimeria intestinalis]